MSDVHLPAPRAPRVPVLPHVLLAAMLAAVPALPAQSWRDLPDREPEGALAHTGSRILVRGKPSTWTRPEFVYDARVATGRKASKVVVLIYDPVLESKDGQRLTEWTGGTDPMEASRILVDVVRQASWGYINYEIVDVLRVDGYTKKVDGFRYTDESYLAARESKEWQSAPTSYRAVFEENGLVERFRDEGIRELWLWGADGFHFDEFAGYIPKRDARFGPTDNPWLYRPYDIPPELGRTTWVMGFNIEVGADNMIHSYSHRVESMAALAVSDGTWDPKTRDDPWNVFSRVALDVPGRVGHVGNCHVPANGAQGYDYSNPRSVPSLAYAWCRYPDVRADPVPISSRAWGGNHFGYQKWFLERLPKGPGWTEYGYDNWWVYVANTDEDLPEWTGAASGGGPGRFRHDG